MKDLIIIAISASLLPEEQDPVLEDGADHFIRKPYRSAKLLSALGKFAGVKLEYKETTTSQ